MGSLKLNRDTLNMTGIKPAANAAMTVIDRLQDFQPNVQLVGLAAAFLSMATHLGIPAQDVFTVTTNLINDAEGKRAEFAAVDAYLEGEVFG